MCGPDSGDSTSPAAWPSTPNVLATFGSPFLCSEKYRKTTKTATEIPTPPAAIPPIAAEDKEAWALLELEVTWTEGCAVGPSSVTGSIGAAPSTNP